MSREQTPRRQRQNLFLFQELDGGTMFFFPPNRAKECGQATIIFQITSGTFSRFNIINDPVLRGQQCILLTDKHTHIYITGLHLTGLRLHLLVVFDK